MQPLTRKEVLGREGLYRVDYPRYKGCCAGFEVKGGRIVRAAPILRRNLWLLAYAVFVCACANPRVEDWGIRTDTCKIDAKHGDAKATCKKYLGADRFRRGAESTRGTAADPGSTPGASTIKGWDEEGNRL